MSDDQARAAAEAKHRRAELLDDLLESAGWREVVAPILKARLREQELTAMSVQDIETLCKCQGAWRLLSMMLREPREFFAVREV